MDLLARISLSAVLAIAIMAQLAQAEIYVSISVNEQFDIGDEIWFNYTLLSTDNQTVDYFANIDCGDDVHQSQLEHRTTELIAYEHFPESYEYGAIDAIGSRECTAYVRIIEPYNMIFAENFSVESLDTFDFELTSNKKVFKPGEDINIDYESDVSGLAVESTLSYPDGTSRSVQLPLTIKVQEAGTYILDATATKAGYRKETDSIHFGIMPGGEQTDGDDMIQEPTTGPGDDSGQPLDVNETGDGGIRIGFLEAAISAAIVLVVFALAIVLVLVRR